MRTTLTSWALALALPQALAQQACAPVNIIIARGSTEQPGVGLMGAISSAAAQQIPGAVVTPLDYPAQLNPYPPSVAAGVVSMTDLLTQQTAGCPQTKLVVMGYSQGAHVALDTLCDRSLSGFTPSARRPSRCGGEHCSVILGRRPDFRAGPALEPRTSQEAGIFQTRDMTQCGDVPAKTLSFCDTNDRFCASGDSIPVHLGYFSNAAYVAEAVQFVVASARAGASNCTTGAAARRRWARELARLPRD
ncbi:Axe2 [Verticillium alfalfae VaMs.102]|uniref:Axe2 n=1 Tax=Verticillium alfalfae (strain VaMs.102 / ATCC MYA-4576 / FGSC 10136) TaxID=526221 RepID=C9SEK2_VERA1|nr:Axe2 [Verticillium alfalfae VaMs.102]EEY16595.1 Axe2 [Verticillium alfalfae VaMs.102]